jgi:hypothetical protein
MSTQGVWLYWLIVACEAAFWIVLVLGLAARYLWRRERLGRALILSLPAVDLLLFAFTALDLESGTPATVAHGLATVYVGFTVAFGALAVRWADLRFAHWVHAGPPPPAAPAGWSAVRLDLALWLRCIVAWAIALVLIAVLIAFVDDAAATQSLLDWYRIGFGSIVVWFVLGPVWSLVFFRRDKAT